IGADEDTQGWKPLLIGHVIVAIGMSLGGPTGFAINPARDLAPRIAHALLPIPGKGDSEWGYSWIPVVGPIIGGVYGALFYKAMFAGVLAFFYRLMTAVVVELAIAAVTPEMKKEKQEINGETNDDKAVKNCFLHQA